MVLSNLRYMKEGDTNEVRSNIGKYDGDLINGDIQENIIVKEK